MVAPPPIDLAVWSAVAGLGVFHGLNPAMGWLFAVAQGMHRNKRSAVLAALAPIVLGHAASVAVVILAFLTLGLTFDRLVVTRIAAGVLLAWGLWRVARRHRPRWQFSMKTSLAGLRFLVFPDGWRARGRTHANADSGAPLSCASARATARPRLACGKRWPFRRPHSCYAANNRRNFACRLRMGRSCVSALGMDQP